MLTLIETPTFVAEADKLWSEAQRMEFFCWLAANPEAGEVIPDSGGCRKLRWSRSGMGKRSGVRVIYFTRLPSGEIWLLLVYAKAVHDNIPAHLLKAIRKELEHDYLSHANQGRKQRK